MSSTRQLVREIFVYSAGDLLVRAMAFFTLPLYTRILSPSDYGVWATVTSAVGLLSALLILGGDTAYARFYFEEKTLEVRRRLTSTWFAFLAVWSLGIVVIAIPFGGPLSSSMLGSRRWAVVLVLSLLSAPVTLMSSLFAQVLRNEFRPKLFAVLNVATAAATVVLSVLFAAVLGWGITGIAAGALAGAVITLPPRIWYARHLLEWRFSASLLPPLLRFGLPLVPTTVAWWIFSLSDRLVLGRLSSLDQVGLYSVANSATSVLALLVGSLGRAWSPHAIRLYEERRDETRRIYGRVLTYILVSFGLLAVALTAFAHDLISMLSTGRYAGAAAAIGPLALGYVAYASVQVTALGISLRKRTIYLMLVAWAAALLNLGLNLAFDKRYGMVAAAWATCAAYVLLTLGYLAFSHRLWPFSIERRKGLAAIAVTAAFTFFAPRLPNVALPAAIGLRSAYVFAAVVALVLLEVVDRREIAVLLSFLRRVRTPRAWSAAR